MVKRSESGRGLMSEWHCRGCEATNDLSDAFCGACGTERPVQPATCQECGESLPTGTRFCPDCGAVSPKMLGEPFVVQEVVGSGYSGLSLRVWDPSRRRTVFVKVLSPNVLDDPLQAERIRHSAQVMSGFECANCVQVLSWAQLDSAEAIICEWVDGASLTRLQSDTTWSADQAFAVLEGVLTGLIELQGQGLTHDFLTPDRVLIDAQGVSHITGAGLPFDDADHAAALTYLAPEVLSGAGGAPSTLADVYTAGRLLHACVDSADAAGVDAQLAADVHALVRTATASHPAYRLRSLTEFRQQLRRMADARLGPNWLQDGTAGLAFAAISIGSSRPLASGVGATVISDVPIVSSASAGDASGTAVAGVGGATAGEAVAGGASSGLLGAVASHPVITVLASAATVVALALVASGVYTYTTSADTNAAKSSSASATAAPASVPAVAPTQPAAPVAPVATITVTPPPAVPAAPPAPPTPTPTPTIEAANIPQGFSYWRTPYNDSGSGQGFTVALRRDETFCTIPIQLDGGGDVVGVLSSGTQGTSWDGDKSLYPEGSVLYNAVLQASDGAPHIVFLNSGEEWTKSTEAAANSYSASVSGGTSNLSFFTNALTKWCG